jgi:hypothetical protein
MLHASHLFATNGSVTHHGGTSGLAAPAVLPQAVGLVQDRMAPGGRPT